MKDKIIKAFVMQIVIAAAIVGVFSLMGCSGVGMLVSIGYICVSSENLNKAFGHDKE